MADSMPLSAPVAALQPWRERLLAAKMFMRYDYAWYVSRVAICVVVYRFFHVPNV